MHAFECFHIRNILDIFHLEHTVLFVLGQAIFGDYLVVYQGVLVGVGINLRYPRLGESVVLFFTCSLIGDAEVGSNCVVGAGVQLYVESIPHNIVVSNHGSAGFVPSPLKWNVRERFLKS